MLTLIDDPSRHMSLDDEADAQRFLPELKSVCPDFNQPCNRGSQHHHIKLKHLVSHTAGLANVMEQTNAHVGVWLDDLKKSWLLFDPGDFGAYSGVGIEGVGLIEQRISGKSYVEFVRDDLFAPLEMSHSSMDDTTLPAKVRAQKWLYAGGYPTNNPCLNACDVAQSHCLDACGVVQSHCMGNAHSVPERQACVREFKECKEACPDRYKECKEDCHLKPTWTFTRFDQLIPGEDQPMMAPAGGLATSVRDLSRFIEMWLSGEAPQVHGRPLLKPATIQSALQSQFSSTAPGPNRCDDGRTDSHGFSYSSCGQAYGFGVGWYVGHGYLEHNGSVGVSGSNTRIDPGHQMGATGLVSTEPYPKSTPQPEGLDSHFIDTVVFGLLSSGVTADAATEWAGRKLAVGVARVLFLSGKEPKKSDLDAFTPDFIADHHLSETKIKSFLEDWQGRIGECHNFRVRDVSNEKKVEVVFTCDKKRWNAVLTVEGQQPHRISWSEVGGGED